MTEGRCYICKHCSLREPNQRETWY